MARSGKGSFICTEMHILDCVPDAERALLDTSTQLTQLIHRKGVFTIGRNLQCLRCISADHIRSALRGVVVKVRNGAMPVLHIDGHASAASLAAANGERIDWDEVYGLFRDINVACGNNLFVSMGLCEALRSFNRCHISMPCPVNALLAAWNPILQSQVEIGFETFYSALFEEGGDVDAAIVALYGSLKPCPLMFFSAKHYLEQGLLQYVRDYCVGTGLEARAKSIADQVATHMPDLKISEAMVKEHLEAEVRNTPSVLRRKARMFLHVDGRPENEVRFAPDVDWVIAEATALLDRS